MVRSVVGGGGVRVLVAMKWGVMRYRWQGL